ncbi:DoxX family protein [Halopiger aswanensis]|uniref:Putative membrane protein YphA (DoxX/SURF4 family) n=1 Tax=Halopiger aswanensis TaxID=148449 RepID=A0A419WSI0_9EURY|nr:DoxX family protein [Halopiger aswanensis]RKD98372.1 putative membrane protein YphA (DoxX/SURF4 family) [Halopiger aswanensis]
MLESLRQRSATDGEATDRSPTDGEGTASKPLSRTTPVRLGRLLYGGVLATMAVDGLMNTEERAEYAAAKGVPMPGLANIGAHTLLLVGGVGIALWRIPAVAASAAAAFFLGVTPAMHDFWTVDDPEQQQQEMINFLKNTALLGGALVFLGVANERERE